MNTNPKLSLAGPGFIAPALNALRNAYFELGEEEFIKQVAQHLRGKPGMGYVTTLRACLEADQRNHPTL